nr:hypothetical protein [Leptolyngbya boryana]
MGEDSFAIAQAVKALKQQTLDPMWESFNFDKFSPEQSDAVVQALNQAMTPPSALEIVLSGSLRRR